MPFVTEREVQLSSMAKNGTVLATTGVAVSGLGNFSGFVALEDCTITAITTLDCTKNVTGVAPVAGDFKIVPQGMYFPVGFSALTVTGTALLVR